MDRYMHVAKILFPQFQKNELLYWKLLHYQYSHIVRLRNYVHICAALLDNDFLFRLVYNSSYLVWINSFIIFCRDFFIDIHYFQVYF